MHIDLNADIGESHAAYTLGDDAALKSSITSANVACGVHGDIPGAASLAASLRSGLEGPASC